MDDGGVVVELVKPPNNFISHTYSSSSHSSTLTETSEIVQKIPPDVGVAPIKRRRPSPEPSTNNLHADQAAYEELIKSAVGRFLSTA